MTTAAVVKPAIRSGRTHSFRYETSQSGNIELDLLAFSSVTMILRRIEVLAGHRNREDSVFLYLVGQDGDHYVPFLTVTPGRTLQRWLQTSTT